MALRAWKLSRLCPCTWIRPSSWACTCTGATFTVAVEAYRGSAMKKP